MDNVFQALNGVKPSRQELKRRVEHVKKIIVHHPVYEQVLEELEMRFDLGEDSVAPDCLYLYGPTGAGKSTVTSEFTGRYRREELVTDSREYTRVTVLHVKVPPKATPRSLASKILFDLGDPNHFRGTESELTSRVHYLFGKCEVKMFILDEFQHLIDSDTLHVLVTASNWVKTFTEEIKIPVVLCGMPESMRIFINNPQLDRRFTNKIELPPFRYGTAAEITTFRKFLKEVEKQLPFAKPSNITDIGIADRIYYTSQGIPFYVMQLLIEATAYAVNAGNDSIEMKHLNQAFKKIKQTARPFTMNPFESVDFELAAELRKETDKENKFKQELLAKQKLEKRLFKNSRKQNTDQPIGG
ncbi:TniB family NTP-binding protein [Cohnella lupini]|uniref:TniB protein n=1 Tax=Cohnella lupini TaxID=1294267 RepID=A0A3D9HTS1_9BACL|nr:TniB family NTP-binding protein [Cohnella lupini]RED52898.1 TniB protein [Cohnella lupini]